MKHEVGNPVRWLGQWQDIRQVYGQVDWQIDWQVNEQLMDEFE